MEEETHQNCNVLAVHIICSGSNSTDVLDVDKNKAFMVRELADDLDRVENLKNKPKILMLQKCRGEKHGSYTKVSCCLLQLHNK